MGILGNTITDRVLCNCCGKDISLRGISVETVQDGELQVQFFFCPHCGKKYLIVATDNELRQTMKRRDDLMKKAALFRRNGFREKSVEKFKREINRLSKDIERQAAALRKSGEMLLEEGTDGQENGKAGPEKISGH